MRTIGTLVFLAILANPISWTTAALAQSGEDEGSPGTTPEDHNPAQETNPTGTGDSTPGASVNVGDLLPPSGPDDGSQLYDEAPLRIAPADQVEGDG